ncbi:MAG: sensor histidine kinase [Candidatus Weimeria sp.]
MEHGLYIVLTISLEFLKLYIFTHYIAGLKYRHMSSCIGLLLCLMAVTCFFLNGKRAESFAVGFAVVAALSISSSRLKDVLYIVISYILICVIDLFLGIIILAFMKGVGNLSGWRPLFVDMMSLVIIIPAGFFFQRKRKTEIGVGYLIVFFIAMVSLAIYLTSLIGILIKGMHGLLERWLILSMAASSFVLLLLCYLLFRNGEKYVLLKDETIQNKKIVESQRKYYELRLQKDEDLRRFQHDIKNHIMLIGNLAYNGKYTELNEYITEITGDMKASETMISTGNELVSAILTDLMSEYPDVKVKWNGHLLKQSKMQMKDMCTVFYNALSNAFEAASSVTAEGAGHYVTVKVCYFNSRWMMTVENPTKYHSIVKNGIMISHKNGEGHGYGIQNIKTALIKYDGSYSYTESDGVFVAEINWNEA